MIKATLTNEILKRITAINENRFSLSKTCMPAVTRNRLRKNSKKKSSYASNRIEGNPLTENQASEVIERDPHRHFLKPEQEIRNYFLALNMLEKMAEQREAFSLEMILKVQAVVEKGASMEVFSTTMVHSPACLIHWLIHLMFRLLKHHLHKLFHNSL